jgi:uncharacterized protein involved in oxidation of intracellular sulfur
MKVGIVIYSNDPETVWNAFRFGNFVLASGGSVRVFLIGKGVECHLYNTDKFKVTEQIEAFISGGGKIHACGTCLEIHQLKPPEIFTVATLKDLHDIVQGSDKVVTF